MLDSIRARMLDSNLSYDIKITLKYHLWCKKCYNFVIMYATLLWTMNYDNPENL